MVLVSKERISEARKHALYFRQRFSKQSLSHSISYSGRFIFFRTTFVGMNYLPQDVLQTKTKSILLFHVVILLTKLTDMIKNHILILELDLYILTFINIQCISMSL